jgi:hypothetical protein
MAPMNKPEWFQLAESDGGLPRRNAKRGFRAIALSVPLMAIGIGVVLAQTSNEAPAVAETTSVAATQSPIASASTPTLVAAPSQSTKSVQTMQPAIAKPPTGGGDDDGDEYEDDDEGDDD